MARRSLTFAILCMSAWAATVFQVAAKPATVLDHQQQPEVEPMREITAAELLELQPDAEQLTDIALVSNNQQITSRDDPLAANGAGNHKATTASEDVQANHQHESMSRSLLADGEKTAELQMLANIIADYDDADPAVVMGKLTNMRDGHRQERIRNEEMDLGDGISNLNRVLGRPEPQAEITLNPDQSALRGKSRKGLGLLLQEKAEIKDSSSDEVELCDDDDGSGGGVSRRRGGRGSGGRGRRSSSEEEDDDSNEEIKGKNRKSQKSRSSRRRKSCRGRPGRSSSSSSESREVLTPAESSSRESVSPSDSGPRGGGGGGGGGGRSSGSGSGESGADAGGGGMPSASGGDKGILGFGMGMEPGLKGMRNWGGLGNKKEGSGVWSKWNKKEGYGGWDAIDLKIPSWGVDRVGGVGPRKSSKGSKGWIFGTPSASSSVEKKK